MVFKISSIRSGLLSNMEILMDDEEGQSSTYCDDSTTTQHGQGHTTGTLIRNIPVDFPFTPYHCQLKYMEKVIEALQNECNAILESPTGTGKTLCLLCATLAWREDFLIKKRDHQIATGVIDLEATSSNPTTTIPKIIYASRTHSQLTQVVRELKRTKYRPTVAIIGSREQMCVNPDVMKRETNAEKVHLCRTKVRSRTCGFYNNTDVNKLHEEIMDIEDLVKAGSKIRMCPYYLARNKMESADLIFMPYNYVLDMKLRKIHSINIKDAVIILDEAHNIESVCEDSTSFSLTSVDLGYCVDDSGYVLKKRVEELEELPDDDESKASLQTEVADLVNLKKIFLTLEETLNEFEIDDRNSLAKPGNYIYEFFNTASVDYTSYDMLVKQCEAAITYLTTCGQKVFKSGGNIQKFLDAAKVVFECCTSPSEVASEYRVYINQEANRKPSQNDPWVSSRSNVRQIRVIRFLCCTPGYAMENLKKQEARSIIITSGTLSPLDGLANQLKLQFPVRHQGLHVISDDQISVSIVKRGCDSEALNCSWTRRLSPAYINSLGQTIVNIARVVPGGLLIFFPSYTLLYCYYDNWVVSKVLDNIEKYKPVFREPKRKSDLNSVMEAYSEAVRNSSSKGAILLAVCRGKVSEGLDFADDIGRTVIVVGIPFAPKEDPKVKSKLDYLSGQAHYIAGTTDLHTKVKAIPVFFGDQDWYRQQAVRAVNQAIGRVIRHKDDYGAIILLDERFENKGNVGEISKWLQPHLKIYQGFGSFQRELTAFFKRKSATAVVVTKENPVTEKVNTNNDGGSISRQLKVSTNQQIDCHPAQEKVKVPIASLAKLSEELPELPSHSFMDSLKHAETRPPAIQPHHTRHTIDLTKYPSAASSHLNLTSSKFKSQSKEAKKKIIIIKKPVKPTDFSTTLKENISIESFQRFKQAICAYKQNGNFEDLFKELRCIFNHPSLFELLLGVGQFVNKKDVDHFDKLYTEFTGKIISRQPSVSSGASSSSETKKRVTEQLSSSSSKKLKLCDTKKHT